MGGCGRWLWAIIVRALVKEFGYMSHMQKPFCLDYTLSFCLDYTLVGVNKILRSVKVCKCRTVHAKRVTIIILGPKAAAIAS